MKNLTRLFLRFYSYYPFCRCRANSTSGAAAHYCDCRGLHHSLAAIEKTIDDKRKEFGIPGLSLAIVKDDKVIYLKGLGVKDFEKKIPVTPDTLFAIGSSSKAFTAMLAVMSADEGKLSLDDSPKKFLPYFTLRDAGCCSKNHTARSAVASFGFEPN